MAATYDVKVKVSFTGAYTIEDAEDEQQAHDEALEQAMDEAAMLAETWTTYKEGDEEEDDEEEEEEE